MTAPSPNPSKKPGPPVLPGVIDSHCHLQSLKEEDREPALDAARERGVVGFLVPAIRLSDAEVLLDLCHRHDDVWCALGVHPHEAATWQAGDEARLEALLADEKAVAVGECGLDFYYDHAPRDVQEQVMRTQWELAMQLDLPVVVHNRDSNEKMVDVVECGDFDSLRADFHSFAGGLEMARRLIPRDHYLGFSGMVTFNRGDNVREVLPELSKERLLVETDSPYLAPVPYRGQPNQPAFVVEVAARVALEWEIEAQELARLSSENFFRLFSKAKAAP
ncbi:MAG: TatD family hydrolase [Acidobacteriota bacterium]